MKQRFTGFAQLLRTHWRWVYLWPVAVLFLATYALATGFGRRCWCGLHTRDGHEHDR